MKFSKVIVSVLFVAISTAAQESHHRPLPDKPDTPAIQMSVPLLFGNDPIPPGMVWVPRGKVWHAEELGSCTYCGRPMTFKQAAFDKKAASLWLIELGLTIGDIEVGQTCLQARLCREGNPLLGSGRRPIAYGIRIPALVAGWWATAMLRKGDRRLNVGGMRNWWIFPVVMQGLTTAGIATGLAQR